MSLQPENDLSFAAAKEQGGQALRAPMPLVVDSSLWSRLSVRGSRFKRSHGSSAQSSGESTAHEEEARQFLKRHVAMRLWRFLRRWFLTSTFAPAWLPEGLRHPLFGYLVAVLLQLISIFGTLFLFQLFPSFAFPGLLSILAVALVALSWGVGPSLIATFLGAILVDYVLLLPHLAWKLVNAQELLELSLFLLIGLAISIVASQTERARRSTDRLFTSLATERARLAAIIETVPDAVTIHDVQGKLVQLNRAGRIYAGPARGGESLAEFASAYGLRTMDGRPFPVDALPVTRALQGETVSGIEMRYLDAKGRDLHMLVSAAPLFDSHHRVDGAVLITHDISALRHTERRTQEALNALLAMAEALVSSPETVKTTGELRHMTSEQVAQRVVELTREVMDCKRVGITAVDVQTHELSSVAVVGLPPEQEGQWPARRPGFYLSTMLMDPAYQERLLANEPLIVDMTQPQFQEYPNPFKIHALLLAPMCIGKQLVGVLSIDYGDEEHEYSQEEIALASAVAKLAALVFERERLLLEREEARANALALSKANRQMEEFLGMVSHELKTPLTSIKGNTQLAIRQLRNSLQTLEKAIDSYEGTERQTRRLNRLVDDLLDVSRAQTGYLEMHLVPCDLVTIVRQAVEEEQRAWPNRAITLDVGDEQTIPVRADADRIAQVLMNYVTNALKYSNEDRPVQVKLQRQEDEARVSVTDSGPGMSPEQQEHIWERFARVPEIEVRSSAHRSNAGLGLGLYISKMIIEQHEGQVGLESVPGEGSTFWFSLPLVNETNAP